MATNSRTAEKRLIRLSKVLQWFSCWTEVRAPASPVAQPPEMRLREMRARGGQPAEEGPQRVRAHLAVGGALEAIHAARPERVLSELASHYAAALPASGALRAFEFARRAAEHDCHLNHARTVVPRDGQVLPRGLVPAPRHAQ